LSETTTTTAHPVRPGDPCRWLVTQEGSLVCAAHPSRTFPWAWPRECTLALAELCRACHLEPAYSGRFVRTGVCWACTDIDRQAARVAKTERLVERVRQPAPPGAMETIQRSHQRHGETVRRTWRTFGALNEVDPFRLDLRAAAPTLAVGGAELATLPADAAYLWLDDWRETSRRIVAAMGFPSLAELRAHSYRSWARDILPEHPLVRSGVLDDVRRLDDWARTATALAALLTPTAPYPRPDGVIAYGPSRESNIGEWLSGDPYG
jgi:hypothetical protein